MTFGLSSLGSPLIGLDAIMTMQAVIQRDQSTRDAHGAKQTHNWQTLATVPMLDADGEPCGVEQLVRQLVRRVGLSALADYVLLFRSAPYTS